MLGLPMVDCRWTRHLELGWSGRALARLTAAVFESFVRPWEAARIFANWDSLIQTSDVEVRVGLTVNIIFTTCWVVKTKTLDRV